MSMCLKNRDESLGSYEMGFIRGIGLSRMDYPR